MSAEIQSSTGSSSPLRTTPLAEEQRSMGARFTDFHGWSLPVSYSTLTEEHHAVRNACGIFDVSHMGEVFVSGPQALPFLESITPNRVSALAPGQAQYSLLLNENGGVVDDIIIYRFAADHFLICVNAGNVEKDWKWLNANNRLGAKLENRSAEYAQIALQGPRSREVMTALMKSSPEQYAESAFPFFTFRTLQIPGLDAGTEVITACTGYTGEDGFEFFVPVKSAVKLWRLLLDAGKPVGLLPAGLGARDTLRLEACLPLHGHELNDELPATACGVSWVIQWEKGDFLGKAALEGFRTNEPPYRLVGLRVLDPGIIREGAKLQNPSTGEEVGWVSSGTKPPTVDAAIGLGFLRPSFTKIGTQVNAIVRGKPLKVEVIKRPFYRRPR